eukprot:1012949_1
MTHNRDQVLQIVTAGDICCGPAFVVPITSNRYGVLISGRNSHFVRINRLYPSTLHMMLLSHSIVNVHLRLHHEFFFFRFFFVLVIIASFALSSLSSYASICCGEFTFYFGFVVSVLP